MCVMDMGLNGLMYNSTASSIQQKYCEKAYTKAIDNLYHIMRKPHEPG